MFEVVVVDVDGDVVYECLVVFFGCIGFLGEEDEVGVGVLGWFFLNFVGGC